MGVPSTVIERIDKLEKAQHLIAQRKLHDAKEVKDRKDMADDRLKRRDDLLKQALAVFAWRDDFVKSKPGQKLWSLIGSGADLAIFDAWYWRGLPRPVRNGLDARTVVSFSGPRHQFLVEDWRLGPDRKPMAWQEVCRLTSPLEMVDHPMINPKMIDELHAHLTGDDAWKKIIEELDRRNTRYVVDQP